MDPVDGLGRPLEHGEQAFGAFRHSDGTAPSFERYQGANVVVGGGGPWLVAGPPQYVAAVALGMAARSAWDRRRAQRAARPRWWNYGPTTTVATSRRLWCQIAGGNWLHFNYDMIAALQPDLDHWSVTLSFCGAGEPLRLTGLYAPWCAVLVAHYVYGRHHAAAMPELARLRRPTLASA